MKVFLKLFLFVFLTKGMAVEQLRVVEKNRTPESDFVKIHIIFPKPYENKRKQPINVQVRLEWYPLGMESPFDRKNEVLDSARGQNVRVVIDNEPYISMARSFVDSFDENRIYFDRIVSLDLPFKLPHGQHVVRVFPARSFGESLKGEGCFDASIFYVQDTRRTGNQDVNLHMPFLTYNEPQGTFNTLEPILLDFYITNCQLSSDGYKVRLSIDDKVERLLIKWNPYYIYGLSRGTHKVRLELLNSENKVVPGIFNVVEREITVE